ncbi:hypothetical protein [Clostridium gasigenes]|uniref:hypothetical protein n=1 Tax=Clostridium gasigenes TaxID=94869 RepID=UPI001C0C6D80|nr:hypothetical protein [Clostridium gasigenes]MBU3102621.1 hypothetical protein [Clostridium gasigenes]
MAYFIIFYIRHSRINTKELIDNEFYFTINKLRQYGKTTTLNELNSFLKEKYLVIDISFEGIGDSVFENERDFATKFFKDNEQIF